jgi:hypothetical protein
MFSSSSRKTAIPLSIMLMGGGLSWPWSHERPVDIRVSHWNDGPVTRCETRTASISLSGLLGAPMDDGMGGVRATSCRDILDAIHLADLDDCHVKVFERESLLWITGTDSQINAATGLVETMRHTREDATRQRGLRATVQARLDGACALVERASNREQALRRMMSECSSPMQHRWVEAALADTCGYLREARAYDSAVRAWAIDPCRGDAPIAPATLSGLPGLPADDASPALIGRVHQLEESLACAARERDVAQDAARRAAREADCARGELKRATDEARRLDCELREARERAERQRCEFERKIAQLNRELDDYRSHRGDGGRGFIGPIQYPKK